MTCPNSRVSFYYESMERKLLKPIYECRCNGRLQIRDLRASHTLGRSTVGGQKKNEPSSKAWSISLQYKVLLNICKDIFCLTIIPVQTIVPRRHVRRAEKRQTKFHNKHARRTDSPHPSRRLRRTRRLHHPDSHHWPGRWP